MTALFGRNPLRVLSAGVGALAPTSSPYVEVTHLDWQPPMDGQPDTLAALAALWSDERVEAANALAIERALAVEPRLVGVRRADDVIPGLASGTRLLLHAGPPIAWDDMCGPMRGALVGATLLEGWASTAGDAERLLDSGSITLEPCHHHNAVGPMAGATSGSMPMWVVEDPATGKQRYANLNEGSGRVLRFGAFDESVLERQFWMRSVLGPAMNKALDAIGGLSITDIIAQALHMGDEVHNRNNAATGQLLKHLASPICATSPTAIGANVLAFLASTDHTFLNISMAAAKITMDAAHGVAGSSIVTAMARNGVEFGIRVSGCGDQWFTAPSPVIDGLFFPGYTTADAAADLGDSAITETAGLGGLAMAASPAIVRFVGGTPDTAVATTVRMREITHGLHPTYTIPILGFAGCPFGIDARAVVDTGIVPVINTGIAHRSAGVGQIGAGLSMAPWECFRNAVHSLHAFPSAVAPDSR